MRAVGRRLVATQQPQTPGFRSSVEVTSLDVGVVDRDGKPITDLTPQDFVVRVDGAPRRVVSAEWVSLVTPPKPDAPPPPPGYSTNENATGGRLILIVIDQPNIRFGGAAGLRRAVNGFIDRLQPSDRIAAVGIGPGSTSTPFTADRERVKQAIARMAGSAAQAERLRFQHRPRRSDGDPQGRLVHRSNGAAARVRRARAQRPYALEQQFCRSSAEAAAQELATAALRKPNRRSVTSARC